jgi:hypothetical protein
MNDHYLRGQTEQMVPTALMVQTELTDYQRIFIMRTLAQQMDKQALALLDLVVQHTLVFIRILHKQTLQTTLIMNGHFLKVKMV